ncbi:MAG: Anti-sigma-factor antagonist and glycosyl transferase [Verrucomicrobiales bacterium]|nr:Anti-sigma-factor antagonist and glycosyl transferase [Verrucomicrobiales bacterium]
MSVFQLNATPLVLKEAGVVLEENVAETAAPPIAILGVPFDNITVSEAVAAVEKMVLSREPHYLATANVDFLVQALHDVELRRILMDAHLVLCDGTPLVWASRLLGNPLPERVAGSDLVPLLLQIAAKKKYTVYFLGGTEEATSKAIKNITSQLPDIKIVGYNSPPFASLMEMDHATITQKIKAAEPDLLFVSFGCPKQEKWIAMHYRKLGVPVCVGVGATIDFLAGTATRAPKWMQKTGTEWTFRLAQEPKRLLRRYTNDLWWFSRAIFKQWWQLQLLSGHKTESSTPTRLGEKEEIKEVELPERLNMATVRQNSMVCEQALSNSRQCLLLLDKVKKIDSTGVGLLIRLQKRARITNSHLILVSPSKAVVSALRLMNLYDFFEIAKDHKEALSRTSQYASTHVVLRNNYYSSKPSLFWQGEITAANAELVWETTQNHLTSKVKSKLVMIDLSRLLFIDSTGLGLMVKTRKVAREMGLKVQFIGITKNVMSVLKLARLEKYLLEDK